MTELEKELYDALDLIVAEIRADPGKVAHFDAQTVIRATKLVDDNQAWRRAVSSIERRADMSNGWIGVDLDGTLAHYDGWQGPLHIGVPVPAMRDRVKAWLAEGRTVKIMTARVSGGSERERAEVRETIETWCEMEIGHKLEVVCCKDYNMIELWDDRCVQVVPNTGEPVGQSTRGLS